MHHVKCSLLVVTAVLAAADVAFSQESLAANAAENKLDLKFVPDDAVAAMVAHPRRLLEAPGMEMLPIEVLTVAAKKHAGFDPMQLEQTLGVIAPPEPGRREPRGAMVLRFNQAIDMAGVAGKLFERGTDVEIKGHKGRVGERPGRGACVIIDDQTLILSPTAEDLHWVLAGHTGESPLRRLMAGADTTPDMAAFLAMEPLLPLVEPQLEQAARQLPPPFVGMTRIPKLVDTVEAQLLSGGPNDTGRFSLFVRSADETSAKELEGLLRQMTEMGRVLFLQQMSSEMGNSGDPDINQAMARYLSRVSEKVVEALQPKREGDMLIYQTELHGGFAAASGVSVSLLLPAVQAAREAARRNQSMNNLKQIALALLNYHDATKAFPPRARTSKDGKPLLSWRVAILPYIEEQQLYNQFHLDEPWDSEHNIKLLDHMPAVFQSPNFPDTTKTIYLTPVGEGTAFSGEGGTKIRQFTDGTSRTIIVVEADPAKAVPWTKPDDLEVSENNPKEGLGNLRPGGFNALFCDGHVQFIANSIDPETLWAMFTRAGGEVIELP